MRRISRLIVFVLVLVSGSLAAWAARPLTPRAAYDVQTRRLENFFRNKTQDEAALRSIYTRDAILVEANGNTIRGRDSSELTAQELIGQEFVEKNQAPLEAV